MTLLGLGKRTTVLNRPKWRSSHVIPRGLRQLAGNELVRSQMPLKGRPNGRMQPTANSDVRRCDIRSKLKMNGDPRDCSN